MVGSENWLVRCPAIQAFRESVNQWVFPTVGYEGEGRGLVAWYMCGPTVWDVSHTGHARCAHIPPPTAASTRTH